MAPSEPCPGAVNHTSWFIPVGTRRCPASVITVPRESAAFLSEGLWGVGQKVERGDHRGVGSSAWTLVSQRPVLK